MSDSLLCRHSKQDTRQMCRGKLFTWHAGYKDRPFKNTCPCQVLRGALGGSARARASVQCRRLWLGHQKRLSHLLATPLPATWLSTVCIASRRRSAGAEPAAAWAHRHTHATQSAEPAALTSRRRHTGWWQRRRTGQSREEVGRTWRRWRRHGQRRDSLRLD